MDTSENIMDIQISKVIWILNKLICSKNLLANLKIIALLGFDLESYWMLPVMHRASLTQFDLTAHGAFRNCLVNYSLKQLLYNVLWILLYLNSLYAAQWDPTVY